jgi:hypothetical protein
MIRTTRRAVRAAGVAVVAVVLVATLGACSGDDADPAPEASGSPSEQAVPGVRTTATVERVTGRWDRDRRAPLRRQVTEAFDAWVDAAYLADGSADAFAVFSEGAAALARRDRALMSNADLRGRFDSVTATDRKLRIDVLSAEGRAVGVTGRFVVVLALTGDGAERTDRIAGRLLLRRAEHGWRVFGYEVKRGRVA